MAILSQETRLRELKLNEDKLMQEYKDKLNQQLNAEMNEAEAAEF